MTRGILLSILALCLLLTNVQGRSLQQGTGEELPEDFEFPTFTCEFQGQFPYVVSVRYTSSIPQSDVELTQWYGYRNTKGDHFCGGVVIAEDAILTAAHCVDPRTSSEATVSPTLHVGGINSDDPVEEFKTVRAFPHPDWSGTLNEGNDLVIIKLNNKTCIKPIAVIGAKDAENQKNIWFLGYGRTAARGNFAVVLQGSQLNTLKTDVCNKRYEMQPEVQDGELCVRGQTTVGVCVGDDGGPLIVQPSLRFFKDTLVGIASRASAECTETEGAAVFMNIQNYKKWIKKTLKSKEFKQA